MIERGESEEQSSESPKLFGQKIPDEIKNSEAGEQFMRQVAVIDNLTKLYTAVIKDPDNDEKMQAFLLAVDNVIHGDHAELMSVISAGVSAIYLVNTLGDGLPGFG